MPTDKAPHDNLNKLLQSDNAPRSPRELDDRIVQHARHKAREYSDYSGSVGFKWLGDGWKTAVGAFSVAVIAVAVTLQSYNSNRSVEPALNLPMPIPMERAEAVEELILQAPGDAEPDQLARLLRERETALVASLESNLLQSSDATSANVNDTRQPPVAERVSQQQSGATARSAGTDIGNAPTGQDNDATGNAQQERSQRVAFEAVSQSLADSGDTLIAINSDNPVTIQTPDNFVDLLALLQSDTVIATPAGLVSTGSLAGFVARLDGALNLVEEALLEADLSVAPYASASPPDTQTLVAKAAALIQAYELTSDPAVHERAESAFDQALADFDVLTMPGSLELTIGFLQGWLASR